MVEHVSVAGQESAARVSADTAFDLHDCDRIIGETAEESGERAGREMAAALAFAVQLRFPATLDVDHGERVVQGAERDASPASCLEEFGGSRGEFVDRKIFRFHRAAIAEPGLERVEERARTRVSGLAKRIWSATARAGDAQAKLAQRALRQANQLRSLCGCHAN